MGDLSTCTECGKTHQATKWNEDGYNPLITPKYCPSCGGKTDAHPDNR